VIAAVVGLLLAALLTAPVGAWAGPSVAGVPPASTKTTSVLRALVIRVYWSTPDTDSFADFTARFDGVDQWYQASSYGAQSVVSTIMPNELKIAGPSSPDCWADNAQSQAILTQAEAAAATAGYRPDDYDRTIVYFPRADCGPDQPGAWADQPGRTVWLNGFNQFGVVDYDVATIVHELGHTFGLSHSVQSNCTDPSTGQPIVFGPRADCGGSSGTEFPENWFDTMGNAGSPWSFSAPVKDKLGWLTGHKIAVHPGSTVTVKPLEVTSDADAAYLTTPTGRQYWFEFRQLIGVDATFLAPVTQGLLINVVDPTYDAGPMLLDMNPATADYIDATLNPGHSWTSPDGYVFSVRSVSAAGAVLHVTAALPAAPATAYVTTDRRAHTATLTWTAPTSALPITGYRVARDGRDAKGTGPWSRTVAGNVRAQTFRFLLPGRVYHLSVRAISAAGPGLPTVRRIVIHA
jgi:hypothetical protein